MSSDRASRPYDVIVYGATGYTGGLVAAYLAKHFPLVVSSSKKPNQSSKGQSLKWAIAGRNLPALQAVAARLPNVSDSASPPIIEASSMNMESLQAMTNQCRCIISTVGPFAKYGENLISACVSTHCDYVDITGETFWVRKMMDNYGEQAKQANIFMLPLSGFDSLPSLMSFHYATTTLCEKYPHAEVGPVTTYATVKGGFSGGTVATMLMMFEQFFSRSTENFDKMDPWLLASNSFKQAQKAAGVSGADYMYPLYDPTLEIVTLPFLMGTINTRAVRASMSEFTEHALETVDDSKSQTKSKRFVRCEYRERMILSRTFASSILAAIIFTVSVILFFILAVIPFTRSLLKRVLPSPGQGPDQEQRKNMYYQYDTIAQAANQHVGVKVQQVGPEAYESTALYCAEVAALLSDAKNREKFLKRSHGFTSADRFMATELMQRVQTRGIKFQVIRQ